MKGKRDLFKTAALVGKTIPTAYQMFASDITDLTEMSQQGDLQQYRAFMLAFEYGYVMGHRATVNGKYKEIEPLKGRGKYGRSEEGWPA